MKYIILSIFLQKAAHCISSVDKGRSGKYVKNFFSGVPHWPPAALPGDSCHLHWLTFASSRLGCTSVQKRFILPAPRGSAEPIWLPGGEYGIPRAPGGCAQQGHESQTEAVHCIKWDQALGGLAWSCQGFQRSSGGGWEGISVTCKKVVEFISKRAWWEEVLCTFTICNTFQPLKALLVLFFFFYGYSKKNQYTIYIVLSIS